MHKKTRDNNKMKKENQKQVKEEGIKRKWEIRKK